MKKISLMAGAGLFDGKASVRLGPVTLILPAAGRTPGPAKLAARPNRINVLDAGTPDTIPGTLAKVTYVGGHLEFIVDTPFGEVFVISRDVDSPLAAGQPVGLGFPARGPVLIAA
jgi:iron(III) transport system ATP-binding protein